MWPLFLFHAETNERKSGSEEEALFTFDSGCAYLASLGRPLPSPNNLACGWNKYQIKLELKEFFFTEGGKGKVYFSYGHYVGKIPRE